MVIFAIGIQNIQSALTANIYSEFSSISWQLMEHEWELLYNKGLMMDLQ